ncbi:hypothetical protein E4Z66_17695 [Aliishimia ponticola]|uniref:Tetratricopeptide repeat protein n=1 Tax=Aliishimia ponticola TaxID=2499833 RepID=A0A4S4N6M3_9RHOB|nr:hypothetical protein [Aliishimia ponticola]THH34796.1 hypothetical protein E4Z66_17695 [Aliishimia ponticola]
MIRHVALLLALLSGPVFAETVYVRAGDHVGFTRIVLNAVPSSNFDYARTGGGASIRFPGFDVDYRVETVFEKITRERLSDVRSEADALLLEIACQCDTRISYQEPNLVILEIFESDQVENATSDAGPASQVNLGFPEAVLDRSSRQTGGLNRFPPEPVVVPIELPQRTAAAPATPTNDNELGNPADQASKQEDPVELPILVGRPDRGQTLPPSFLPLDNQGGAETRTLDAAVLPESLNDLQQQLAEQIGLAATQGVLNPKAANPPNGRRVSSRIDPRDGSSNANGSRIEPLLNRENRQGDNLSSTSSVIRSNISIQGERLTSEGLSCLDEELFNVSTWGEPGAFDEAISSYREQLYGEFDALNKDAQQALAKSYAYYGFGAEALQTLSLDDGWGEEEAAIYAVATILETGAVQDVADLARFAECDDPSAIWSILAMSAPTSSDSVNAKAALRALNELPMHLRAIVAPELSNRFRALGDVRSASLAMRTLSRAKDEPSAAAQLEAAEVRLEKGDEAGADDQLETVAASGTLEAPLALIRLIELKAANRERVSHDMAVLASAYAQEFRDSEIADDLNKAHIIALSRSGDFLEAFQALEESAKSVSTPELIAQLYRTLQEDAPDVTFLQKALGLPEPHKGQIPARTKLSMSERLLTLGFSDEADSLIAEVDPSIAPRQQQLLRGQIHLAKGFYRQALAAAETFSGPEFDQLKADALYASGAFEEAADLYAALGDDAAAEEAEGRIQSELQEALSDPLTTSAQSGGENTPTAADDRGPLSQAESLISGSEDLANELNQLLTAPELQVDAGL